MKTTVSVLFALIVAFSSLGGSAHARPMQQANPELNVTSVNPTNVDVDSPATQIIVTAAGPILPGDEAMVKVVYNNLERATTLGVGANEFVATIPAVELVTPGSYPVGLKYAPGGTQNSTVPFTVNNIQPLITGITTLPANVRAGQAAVLTITGIDFASGSSVTVGGIGRTVTSRSATQLVVSIPAGVHTTPGVLTVVVIKPRHASAYGR